MTKIKLLIDDRFRRGWMPPNHQILPILTSLPFFWSRMGSRVHRIRSANVHAADHRPSHTCFVAWCGQVGIAGRNHLIRLCEEPPEGMPICATCEGRAIGAGQVGAAEIAGRSVIFSPRKCRR